MIGLENQNGFEMILTFLFDLFIFSIRSVYYIIETLILTILPKKFRKEKNITGKVVLITGGGGGVGRYLALNFAKSGSIVLVWDINLDAIQTTIELLVKNGYTCKGYVVDISNRKQVYDTAQNVKNEFGPVDILINNAAIVCCKPFWELPEKVIENTYNVNVLSHYWTVKAFLPEMMASNTGHIVTVGSVAGLMGTYGCSDYSATKFALNGFHEALYCDLKTHGYDGINLTLVCPYYINTGMFAGVKPRLFPMLEPKYVADQVLTAVKYNQVWCVLPNNVRMLLPLKCLLPAKMCWDLMSRVIRGPESMMMFKGRGKVAAG